MRVFGLVQASKVEWAPSSEYATFVDIYGW